MSKTDAVLKIDKPHFSIEVYEDFFKLDLKGTLKNEIEEAFENKPILKETLGGVFGVFVPLHIHLRDIDMVDMDKTGKVKIKIPRRRDVTISLDPKNAKKLVDKLNQLIPKEKDKELRRVIKEKKGKLKLTERGQKIERAPVIASTSFPVPEPQGVLEEEKEAEEEIEEEEEEKD